MKASEKAIELNPNYSRAWILKGRALRQLDQDEDALRAYNKGLKLNPNGDDAWFYGTMGSALEM